MTDDYDNDLGTILVPKVEVEDIPTEEVNEEHETAKTAQYLNEVVPFGDTPYKMGVVNLNIDTPVQFQPLL